MQNQPKPDDRLAQKGAISWSIEHIVDRRSLTSRPGIKHRSFASSGQALTSREMDTRNRVTRLTLSSNGAGNQPQAQMGEIAQEANAPGKARGYADVGTDYRKIETLAEVTSCGRRAKSY